MSEVQKEEQKAYDLKKLTERLKVRGLDVAEEAAAVIVEELSDWVIESAPISKTPFDDVLVAVMPIMKKELLKVVDKIDGEEG